MKRLIYSALAGASILMMDCGRMRYDIGIEEPIVRQVEFEGINNIIEEEQTTSFHSCESYIIENNADIIRNQYKTLRELDFNDDESVEHIIASFNSYMGCDLRIIQ